MLIAGRLRNVTCLELVLPIVESALLILTRSCSAPHAAGIWQIIPSTGRNYGLKQTQNYDARRDVRSLYDRRVRHDAASEQNVDGDWLLTVAAYNSGEGRVMRIPKQTKARDVISGRFAQRNKTPRTQMLALSEISQTAARRRTSANNNNNR